MDHSTNPYLVERDGWLEWNVAPALVFEAIVRTFIPLGRRAFERLKSERFAATQAAGFTSRYSTLLRLLSACDIPGRQYAATLCELARCGSCTRTNREGVLYRIVALNRKPHTYSSRSSTHPWRLRMAAAVARKADDACACFDEASVAAAIQFFSDRTS